MTAIRKTTPTNYEVMPRGLRAEAQTSWWRDELQERIDTGADTITVRAILPDDCDPLTMVAYIPDGLAWREPDGDGVYSIREVELTILALHMHRIDATQYRVEVVYDVELGAEIEREVV